MVMGVKEGEGSEALGLPGAASSGWPCSAWRERAQAAAGPFSEESQAFSFESSGTN